MTKNGPKKPGFLSVIKLVTGSALRFNDHLNQICDPLLQPDHNGCDGDLQLFRSGDA